MTEAHVGLGEDANAQELLNAVQPAAGAEWMIQTIADQLARLRELLAKSPLSRIK